MGMCVIIKLLAYSIRDNTHKVLMDCRKFHMTDDVKFLLSTVRSECQQCSYNLNPLLIHRTVGIILEYLNCHMYNWFVVDFTLVGQLIPSGNLLIRL